MEEKKRAKVALNAKENELIEQLRRQPQIMERVQEILQIAQAEGPLRTADEIEELLLEEMRRLGNATMNQWAAQAHERISREVQAEDRSLLKRKKKR